MKREQEANPKLEPSAKGADLCFELEELPPIVAPGMRLSNSNETLVNDGDLESEVEELEQIVAPRLAANSNETMLSDPEE